MLNLLVSPRAQAQLASLPEIAARAVDDVLVRLPFTPFIGVELLDDLGDMFFRKLVVVRRRRWTLHIIYRVEARNVVVEYIDASWIQRGV